MKALTVTIIIQLTVGVALSIPIPGYSDQTDARLDTLFTTLKNSKDAAVLQETEADIWAIWFDSGREEIDNLMEKAGIEVGMMGGITTDAGMMTSCQDIYAAGDVCETFDIARNQMYINAIWPMAVEQGRIAGLNMAGENKQYGGSVRMNSIGNFIGIPAMSMGVTRTDECSYTDAECRFQEVKKRTRNTYKKIILKNGCIVGAIFIGVGQTQRCGIISILLRRQIEVSDYIQALMSNNLSFLDVLPLLRRFGDKFTEPEFKELMDTGL
jgi:NAD(P)H-nitrite reductase large subunit